MAAIYNQMKSSLAHLPENKQYEIQRISAIIKEVVDPEKIILFGSYAKGTYVEARYRARDGITYEYISDYDFLVVTKDNPEKSSLQEAAIMDRVDRYRPPVNLEIHDIKYINEGLEKGEYFFVDIVKEGISIFDRSNLRFSAPRELTNKEKKDKAQLYFDTWFPQSNEFMIDCNHDFKRGNYKKGVFELHQGTESLYYATLLVFSDYKPKTHNLWKLRKKAKPYSEELFSIFRTETDKNEEHLFDLLKRGYVDARYRTDYQISKEELGTLIQRVAKMSSLVECICKDKIDSFTV